MDKQLIKTVNQLQDALAPLGTSSDSIDLPQITVVGSQSSGKSSVLENIVGRDFLPRGTGIVTRRPLVLQLINRPAPTNQDVNTEQTNDFEWGEFLHLPGQKIHDFNKIRHEIERETDATTGNKGISSDPIGLRIYSPNVLTLTLVDLPGLTKVPVGDQPKDIERQIRDMLLKFIQRPNAIILAVTAANTDLANSDGLKLAREVDPEGARTIGVLTKVDLMDQGTDVDDILSGRVIPLRLGYVPVVNRGQQDIKTNKSIKDALSFERKFFESHQAYQAKAQFCGTPHLASRLNRLLMMHIQTTLPEIKVSIESKLKTAKRDLAALGPTELGNPSSVVLSVVTEFCNEYRKLLEGRNSDVGAQELLGGARIAFVYHEVFAKGVNVLDPFDTISDSDIRTVLHNSAGVMPALFVSSKPFVFLMKRQVKRFEEPSVKCIELIHDELVRILNIILSKREFNRYPDLKQTIQTVFLTYIRQLMTPTTDLVKDLVEMEATYINTAHPDLIKGTQAMDLVKQRSAMNRQLPNLDPKTGKPLPSSKSEAVSVSKQDIKDAPFGGFFGDFFSSRSKKRLAAMETPPPVLKASGDMSEGESVDVEIIKLLINSYFEIVRRTIADLVPKAITYNLVLASRENIQAELLEKVYKAESVEELVSESRETVKQRQRLLRMIDALTKSQAIVAGV